MSPNTPKPGFKNLNVERKQEKKKKFLKAAIEFKKEIDEDGKVEDRIKIEDISTYENGDSENVHHKIPPRYTISIAVPGSILDTAQTSELRTYLAGQVARAASIYCVNEVIVYDDGGTQTDGEQQLAENSCGQLAKLLQYLECPQYLRKYLFPLHKDLQYAGLLNPLDAPHHLRQSDDFPYREGVVSHHLVRQGKGSYVNVGLLRDVCIDKAFTPGVRVTVKLLPQKKGSKKRFGVVVPPSQPRSDLGVYWGYSVRLARSLSDIFAKAPFQEGYDLTIGTSDKGNILENCDDLEFSSFKHILIVFGGQDGLESTLECDENLSLNNVSLLFDKYLNTCPNQGSRTIRTEEAILISLAQITAKLLGNH